MNYVLWTLLCSELFGERALFSDNPPWRANNRPEASGWKPQPRFSLDNSNCVRLLGRKCYTSHYFASIEGPAAAVRNQGMQKRLTKSAAENRQPHDDLGLPSILTTFMTQLRIIRNASSSCGYFRPARLLLEVFLQPQVAQGRAFIFYFTVLIDAPRP
jgi:hypothetical protein